MRLRVAWMGKTRSATTAAATAEAGRRLRAFARTATVATEEIAGARAEARLLRYAAGARLFLCDPAGRSFTSPEFARFLETESSRCSQELVFAVGGADGFAAAARAQAHGLVSLSPLTFSHELARLVLIEQVYRALAILSHHPYPH